MSNLILKFDPHRQSFLFFRWTLWAILCVLGASLWLTLHWKGQIASLLLDNIFVYLPNYLTHEILGHNVIGGICYRLFYNFSPQVGQWLATLAGNGIETLLPLLILLYMLRLEGGRWAIAPLLYWLASTFYGAGVYAQDARACSLPLTSSDMITNYKPGEICGDWNHILEPLGLLQYDQWFAYTFLFIGCLLCVLALFSLWYYWTHTDQFLFKEPIQPITSNDQWQPPNIYTPQPNQQPGSRN